MRIENSFLPVHGVGERTERKLWQAGITHWDEFEGEVVGTTLTERIEQFIAEGRRALEARDLSPFAEALPAASRWRLYENVPRETCYLDIETTGLDATRHQVTTVSCHQGGETTTFVSGRDLTADRLTETLEDAALLVTFNGQRFDIPFLETAFDLRIDCPHVDLLYPCRTLGLDGGLKTIERTVGIEREQPDISGRDAVRLWRQYERGDERALDTLVEYNRADTKNMEPLMELVARQLHEDVFEAALRDA